MRNKTHLLVIALFILSIFPLLFKVTSAPVQQFVVQESFDPKLIRLNSVHKMTNYIDSIYNLKAINVFDTAAYTNIAAEVTAKRFYFGLSNYHFSENWIAYVCGKIFWPHFMAIVSPNDILKYPEGLCSQQTIVFMEVLRQKGINVRTVGFGKEEGPGHFLCEVFYNKDWHLFDVTKEPKWLETAFQNQSYDYYLSHKDELYLAYKDRLSLELFSKLIENVEYGKTNSFPAKKMFFFHKFTYILTYLIPVILGLFLFFKFRKRKFIK